METTLREPIKLHDGELNLVRCEILLHRAIPWAAAEFLTKTGMEATEVWIGKRERALLDALITHMQLSGQLIPTIDKIGRPQFMGLDVYYANEASLIRCGRTMSRA